MSSPRGRQNGTAVQAEQNLRAYRWSGKLPRRDRRIGGTVTRFGEELTSRHLDTLATELDVGMREDYQRALGAHEEAKAAPSRATTAADVTGVTRTLADGRFARACVLAAGDQPETRLVRLGDRRVAW